MQAENDRYTLRILAGAIENLIKIILSVLASDLIHNRYSIIEIVETLANLLQVF